MTKLLILILILKIAVVVVVGIACGALILRFIFEVGATQTSTNSRSQQWPGKSNKKRLAGRTGSLTNCRRPTMPPPFMIPKF
jgi:hypothetical protein